MEIYMNYSKTDHQVRLCTAGNGRSARINVHCATINRQTRELVWEIEIDPQADAKTAAIFATIPALLQSAHDELYVLRAAVHGLCKGVKGSLSMGSTLTAVLTSIKTAIEGKLCAPPQEPKLRDLRNIVLRPAEPIALPQNCHQRPFTPEQPNFIVRYFDSLVSLDDGTELEKRLSQAALIQKNVMATTVPGVQLWTFHPRKQLKESRLMTVDEALAMLQESKCNCIANRTYVSEDRACTGNLQECPNAFFRMYEVSPTDTKYTPKKRTGLKSLLEAKKDNCDIKVRVVFAVEDLFTVGQMPNLTTLKTWRLVKGGMQIGVVVHGKVEKLICTLPNVHRDVGNASVGLVAGPTVASIEVSQKVNGAAASATPIRLGGSDYLLLASKRYPVLMSITEEGLDMSALHLLANDERITTWGRDSSRILFALARKFNTPEAAGFFRSHAAAESPTTFLLEAVVPGVEDCIPCVGIPSGVALLMATGSGAGVLAEAAAQLKIDLPAKIDYAPEEAGVSQGKKKQKKQKTPTTENHLKTAFAKFKQTYCEGSGLWWCEMEGAVAKVVFSDGTVRLVKSDKMKRYCVYRSMGSIAMNPKVNTCNQAVQRMLTKLCGYFAANERETSMTLGSLKECMALWGLSLGQVIEETKILWTNRDALAQGNLERIRMDFVRIMDHIRASPPTCG